MPLAKIEVHKTWLPAQVQAITEAGHPALEVDLGFKVNVYRVARSAEGIKQPLLTNSSKHTGLYRYAHTRNSKSIGFA